MKSEKTKKITSLCLGVLSLVLWIMPQVIGGRSDVPEWVHYECQDFGVLFLLASIAIGILAIITGRSDKVKRGVALGWIGVGLSTISLLGSPFFFLETITNGRLSRQQEMQALSGATQQYCEQNEGTLPNANMWCDQLLKSANNVDNFALGTFSGRHGSTSNRDEKRSGYAFNKNLDGYQISKISCPTVLLFETDLGWNQNGTSAILASK